MFLEVKFFKEDFTLIVYVTITQTHFALKIRVFGICSNSLWKMVYGLQQDIQFSSRKIGSKRYSNLIGGTHQSKEKSEVRERFLTDRLASHGNVFVAVALSETT